MRIELLREGATECPLIVLEEFDSTEVESLQEACRALEAGSITEFPLDRNWLEPPLNTTGFVWRATAIDHGVLLPATGEPFVME